MQNVSTNATGLFRRTVALLAVALLALTPLAGCQEAITLSPGAVNANDSCSKYRATISEARRSDIQKQQQNAAAGALVGAMLGAVMSRGDDSGARNRSILMGAAAGGLAGYSATYYRQKAQRAKDNRALLASVNGDAAAERKIVTKTGQATVALRNCRSAQLSDLTRRVKAGKVSKSAARAELRTIQSRVNADNKVISAAFNGIGKRVDAYVDSRQAVAKADKAISTTRARSSTPQVTRAANQQASTVKSDQARKARIDSQIEALDVLLG